MRTISTYRLFCEWNSLQHDGGKPAMERGRMLYLNYYLH